MLHRINKIISAKPYAVVCEWNNGEIRIVQLEKTLKEWATPAKSVFKALLDYKTFMLVSLDRDSKTLFWPGLLDMKTLSGELIQTQLDLDPEVLYRLSEPI